MEALCLNGKPTLARHSNHYLSDDVIQLRKHDSCKNHAELPGRVIRNVEIVAEVIVITIPALVVPHTVIKIQIRQL